MFLIPGSDLLIQVYMYMENIQRVNLSSWNRNECLWENFCGSNNECLLLVEL